MKDGRRHSEGGELGMDAFIGFMADFLSLVSGGLILVG
jgi:hypothetical protein